MGLASVFGSTEVDVAGEVLGRPPRFLFLALATFRGGRGARAPPFRGVPGVSGSTSAFRASSAKSPKPSLTKPRDLSLLDLGAKAADMMEAAMLRTEQPRN